MIKNEIELRKFVSPELVFGVDSRFLAGRYAKNFGARKALVVTDQGVIAAGWTKHVTDSLKSEGILYEVFSGVSPNPRAEEVMQGEELYNSYGCNIIIAVGGGSPIDCAKGIGIVSSNKQHILKFEGIDKVLIPMPPLICVPTTGGTSADVSQFDIITDYNNKVKIAIISKTLVPDVTLVDPVTLSTMDSYLTACTGIDALVHAIEAFVSNASSPITDMHALEAIRLLSKNLLPSIAELDNIELRSNMMLGSLEAGLAFSNASLGCIHAMAHSLGGVLDLPHGECNAILLRHGIRFNFEKAVEKYEAIGKAMNIDLRGMNVKEKGKAILKEIDRLRTKAGVNKKLSQKGISIADIPKLAKNAIKDACMATNPRHANKRDIEVIYEEAL